MSTIPTTLFKSFFQDGGHNRTDFLPSTADAGGKKTDDMNRVNRARSHRDGDLKTRK